MLGESLSYYKSQLKHAAKSGPQLVTIESVIIHNPSGYTVKYVNDNIEHEEYYDIRSGFKDFLKLYKILDAHGDAEELTGKQLWIVIRHNITLDQNQNEIKRESEIVYCSLEDKRPEYPSVFEEYDIAAV